MSLSRFPFPLARSTNLFTGLQFVLQITIQMLGIYDFQVALGNPHLVARAASGSDHCIAALML